MLFEWNEKLALGIEEIDEQHKQLVAMLNKMHEAVSAGDGLSVLGKILGELLEYTYSHFATEENLMMQYEYDGYYEHKKAHDRLNEQALAFQNEFNKENPSVLLPLKTIGLLKDWLYDHIMKMDKKYAPFIADKLAS